MPSLRNHYINAFASYQCSRADLNRELGQMSVCIISASGFFADAPNEVSDLRVGASSKLTRPSRSECGRHSFGHA